MNKQEAIKELMSKSREIIFGDKEELLDQLKPVVPKFVAEWYERNNDDLNTAICGTITGAYRKVNGENDDFLDTFESWLVYEGNSILILAQMKLFGYDVEQEPLYQIFMKNTTNHKNQIQQLVKQGNKWFFCGNDVHRFKIKFTKGQIEAAGFGWVFDCKGVKVKEVEE